MWILISFAIIALILFVIMTLLKIEPLISIVISVLSGLILAYFIERITITYTDDGKGVQILNPSNTTTNNSTNPTTNNSPNPTMPVIGPGVTSVHSSSNSSSNSNNASNAFGFFQSK